MGANTIEVWYFGKEPSSELSQILNHYQKQLKKWVQFSWVKLNPGKSSNIDLLLKQEADKVFEKLQPKDFLILLSPLGNQLSTKNFADQFSKWQTVLLDKKFVFLIGGAYGVTQQVRNKANFIWSLSPLTFPHDMVKWILIEQIYRVFSILNHQPYHHE
ncbi:MAG: 23S rRNA (pseudouridine(1915)-N(3))-methyltransferase RlmH [Alphaproteobacteria bacterium]|nr:23S rRNA (pseudouridine(1915)-N(3))-methyltransferase RlmH [Alphaproteobacteria bacterium]